MAIDPAATARRRRELTGEELRRLRDALAPDATAVSAEPLLGGVDTATYALHLSGRGGATEYVVRVFRDQEGDPSAIARRDYAALTAA
jgi:hypothetical protein